MSEDVSATKRIKLSAPDSNSDEFMNMSKEELVSRLMSLQRKFNEHINSKMVITNSALTASTASATMTSSSSATTSSSSVTSPSTSLMEKLKLQVLESSRNESILVLRLAAKEQENQELLAQIQEMKTHTPSTSHLQSMLLDPSVNLMFVRMSQEIDMLRNNLEQAQKDLAAWKFTPDSQTGKRLMAKCRMLIQENEDLGKAVSSGKIAKLEGEIALNKELISEMKRTHKETEQLMVELDEDLEGMQTTVSKQRVELERFNQELQHYKSNCTCALARNGNDVNSNYNNNINVLNNKNICNISSSNNNALCANNNIINDNGKNSTCKLPDSDGDDDVCMNKRNNIIKNDDDGCDDADDCDDDDRKFHRRTNIQLVKHSSRKRNHMNNVNENDDYDDDDSDNNDDVSESRTAGNDGSSRRQSDNPVNLESSLTVNKNKMKTLSTKD